MDKVELPQSLPTYFAFAETEPGPDCRRFSITLSYLDHGRAEKIQWWWRLGFAEETMLGEGGLAARRQREIERFHRHIERWLENNSRRLYGDGPFPCLGPRVASDGPVRAADTSAADSAAQSAPLAEIAHG